MSANPIKRKLAAILAADAVGYSRLMAADEEGTMKILAAHRAMIDGIIELQEGRIVNTAGDSVIAEFESPVQAVRCAVEIQDALRTRNDSLPEVKRLVFRIGVNLGDVMVKGDDLLGDGVNVAARLESIADPGGICMSSSVYDQIAGKLDLSFVDVGHKLLKNIERPVRVYRIDRNGRSGTRSARGQSPAAKWLISLALLATSAFGAWHFFLLPMQEAAQRTENATASRAAAEERLRLEAMERDRAAAEQQRAESEKQRAVTEAALAKQLAAAQTAQRHAEAQASAAADAKRALEAQHLAEGRARAEADLARLRAEAEEAKRKAATELAAATAARRAADKIALAAPAVPAPAPAPPLRDGLWRAEISCPQFKSFPPRVLATQVSAADGDYLIEEGERGQPGSLALRGAIAGDGAVLFNGPGITGRRGGARAYQAGFTVRLVGSRYEGSGQLGERECRLILTRQ